MKKSVLALTMLLILGISTQAQKKIMTVGIKGGLNISDVAGFNGDNRLSGHVGVILNGRLSSQWSVQPELLYSGQGQQFISLGDEYTLALSYLQLPVMFQFHPIKKFYLEFGPQLGFMLAANYKNDDDKWEGDQNFKKVDIGLGFGVGIQATRSVGFYARYNLGLADISKNNLPDYTNRVGQIGVSFKFK